MKPRSRPRASKISSKDTAQPAALPISQQAIEQIAQHLKQLPKKQKEFWSIREAIAYLNSPITNALTKGYSRKEIAALIRTAGIPISDTSLNYQLAQIGVENSSTIANAPQTRRLKTKNRDKSSIKPTRFPPLSDITSQINTAASSRVSRDTVEDVISYLISDT